MGFKRHRRRGGGGFGGGGHGHGGHGGHHGHGHGHWGGEPNGLQPGDDVGNRKSFKAVQVPPDDLGNRKDPEEADWVPNDDVGNRIDAAPTHELSGVLLDMNGKRRGRRPKGVSAPERVGRYFVGGVNPLIATNVPRAFPGKSLEESMNGTPHHDAPVDGGGGFDEGPASFHDGGGTQQGGRGQRRRGRDQVDGVAAQEVSERRAQRFFDFEEDDRFDYTLKTPAEQKRKEAEDAVRSIAGEAGREAVVVARLIDDGNRPKVLVTIDEKGPAASLPPERRAENANEPLFMMGNAALMSLNYLVNKIVNRYPDDRIRLAILPANDERLYLDALAEHQKIRGSQPQASRQQRPQPHAPARVEPARVEPAVARVEAAQAPANGAHVEPVPAAIAHIEEAEAPREEPRALPAPVASEAVEADGDVEEPKAKRVTRKKADADEEAEEKPKRARKTASASEDEEKPAAARGRGRKKDDDADEAPKSAKAKASAVDEKPAKRPLKKGPRKAPAVEVVRAAPRKST